MRSRPNRWWPRVAAALVTASLALIVGPGAGASAKGSTEETLSVHVLPVGGCSYIFAFGGPNTRQGWVPGKLAAAMPVASARVLAFYAVGTEKYLPGTMETVLGPRGWKCQEGVGGNGRSEMAIYPPGSPNPITTGEAAPRGEQLIVAYYDDTNHLPGIDGVCEYFPLVARAGEPCPSTVPKGEQVTQLTPDVVAITDPAGVKGNLAGSGGDRSVTGLAIVPEGSGLPQSVNTTLISCNLRSTALCMTILGDFVIREFPTPTYPTS